MTFNPKDGAPDEMKPVKNYLNGFSKSTKERNLLPPTKMENDLHVIMIMICLQRPAGRLMR